jgi:hypothetical protein|tara:strand:+ start:403 stop:612 length:210 start_codon:yes stop_codon:yes gene_type:complete
MTVQELIDELQNYPKDMMVVVSGYEGGCNDMSKLETIRLDLNVNTEWYYGSHRLCREGGVPALWLTVKE